MKLVVISDTHERHRELTNIPDGDVLIHCGDWTNKGSLVQIQGFLAWFTDQPHQHKIFIPGNHELSLDKNEASYGYAHTIVNDFTGANTHYLLDSSVTIDGVKFYGSPTTPWFYNWAFNVTRGDAIAKEWAKIPDDTNVLITHGPPYRILDMTEEDFSNRDLNQGCKDLLKRLQDLNELKAHVFGHLHTDGGKQEKIGPTVFANAAMCDEKYHITRKPVEIEI